MITKSNLCCKLCHSFIYSYLIVKKSKAAGSSPCCNKPGPGLLSLAWLRENATDILVKIEVPCNTTAKLILPDNNLIAKDSNGKEMEIKNGGINNYVTLLSGLCAITVVSK